MNELNPCPNAEDVTPESRHRFGLRMIAVYKMVQALGLVMAAAVAFHLKHQRNLDQLLGWLAHLSLSDAGSVRRQAMGALIALGPRRFVVIGVVALGYAALFATEGVGLWRRKHWAEWLTVIATGSLIPIELYEVARHPGALKLGVLLANVVIVIYLARIAMQPHKRH